MKSETSKLRLYVDSSNVTDWQRYLPTGIFYGVTTNPKLLRQEGINFKIEDLTRLAIKAFKLGAYEIHLQVWGDQTEPMLEIGRQLAQIDERVAVKVPINIAGIHCARQLIAEGANVTLTAVHSAQQSLIAIALGARYAAPYLSRMTDGGLNGMEEVIAMKEIVSQMTSPLKLLVASIRQIEDLVTLARNGLDTFTILPSLIEELLENELTQEAIISFEQAIG